MATDASDLSAGEPQPPVNNAHAILDLDALALVARLNQSGSEAMIATLSPDQAQTLVDRLKEGADRHWSINPNRSLEMADSIITIGTTRGDVQQRALGLMARGDALKLLGHSQEAWDTLETAGNLFRDAGDEVGWARTRIGRLILSVYLNRVDEAFSEEEKVKSVFLESKSDDLILRYIINSAIVYYYLGKSKESLDYFEQAISLIDQPTIKDKQFLGIIYTNIGAVNCSLLGDYQEALHYFQKAFELAVDREEPKNIVLAQIDISLVFMQQGKYSKALNLLHKGKDLCENEGLTFEVNYVIHLIAECYLSLNRFEEAKALARQVIKNFRASGEAHREAHTLLQLAMASSALQNFQEAEESLDRAEKIFSDLGAEAWVATTLLQRGMLALGEGKYNRAMLNANKAASYFKQIDQQTRYVSALVLGSQAAYYSQDLQSATRFAQESLLVAKQMNVPLVRYKSNYILGKIAEDQQCIDKAKRRYEVAISTIERVQQGMAVALRTGFMGDKNEAIQALIGLCLRRGEAVKGFETLERAKSQTFFEYIANQQLLRWPDNPECRDLIVELDRLRDEHHWWYQKLHGELQDDKVPAIAVTREDAFREVASRERSMRAITEQLYLHSSANAALNPSRAPRLPDIQAALDEDTLLVAYYHDGATVWAFAADRQSISAQALLVTAAKVERDIDFLQLSIDRALTQGSALPSETTAQAQRILKRLYDGLLTPLADRLPSYRRLIFVPYGHLHYLPFHLLHTGTGYLIESHEVVVEPAASYLVQSGPERSGGARVIAHSWAGALPSAPIEGQAVHTLFAGEFFQEEAANRQALAAPPTQILHIAAHAEYRLDQPDLSYIELADGQLRTDDLLQQDLSYELVTLSACETGRAYVAASDELIGLGRGFLYAGAGALVASLWRVADEVAQCVMTAFYQALHAGESKAAALRHAQRVILADQPDLHPAFWGAFQLVGDPRPLSHSKGEPL